MASGKSVLVIGGGVIGLCTAYYAMKAGHKVTVLEREAREHDGCSFGNAGMVVPSHFIPLAAPGMVGLGLRMLLRPDGPFYLRPRLDADLLHWVLSFMRAANAGHVARSAPLLRDLNLASRACYEALADESGNEFGLVKKGLLMLCRSESALHHEARVAAQAKALNVPAQVVSPEEAARLDPAVRMDIAGGVYFPHDCHLNPGHFVSRLTERLEREGVGFLWSTEVWDWTAAPDGISAVSTNHGSLSADEYVVAGGAWSSVLMRRLGLRLPLQAGKGYSITLPAPRELPALCSIFTEARVAVTPMGDSLRFAGTMEITGLDTSINRRRVGGILKSIPAYMPAFKSEDFRGLPVWTGLRPCSPDGMPYIGRPKGLNNLCIATGHAMMGMSLGPITGKLVAELLSDREPSLDIGLLRPNRYA